MCSKLVEQHIIPHNNQGRGVCWTISPPLAQQMSPSVLSGPMSGLSNIKLSLDSAAHVVRLAPPRAWDLSLSSHICSPVACFCQVESSFIHKDEGLCSLPGVRLYSSIKYSNSTVLQHIMHSCVCTLFGYWRKGTVYNCFILILTFSSTTIVVVLMVFPLSKVLLSASTLSRISHSFIA